MVNYCNSCSNCNNDYTISHDVKSFDYVPSSSSLSYSTLNAIIPAGYASGPSEMAETYTGNISKVSTSIESNKDQENKDGVIVIPSDFISSQ